MGGARAPSTSNNWFFSVNFRAAQSARATYSAVRLSLQTYFTTYFYGPISNILSVVE